MIEFNVTLTKRDIKKFVLYKIWLKKSRFIFPAALYIFCSIVFLFCGFFSRLNFLFLICFAFFILFFILLIKIYYVFKKMFLSSLGVVGKERDFFVDSRCLEFIYKKNIEFCGKYFFYDLKRYAEVTGYLYLFFNDNIFIIIPNRSLKEGQYEKIISILKRNAEFKP